MAKKKTKRPQVLSFGGGVDSMCMLIDAMQRGELPDVVVFLDVGDPDREDPAEWPETYTYIKEVAIPLMKRLGVEFVWVTSKMYPIRDARSLWEWFQARQNIPIAATAHTCSIVSKVERFERWMKDRFAPGTKVDVWIGFAKGEEKRRAKDPHGKKAKKPRRKKGESAAAYRRRLDARVTRHNRFPLMERGLTRKECMKLIAKAGFRVPRKSACVFCPFGKGAEWDEFARELPEVFRRLQKMERDKPPTERGYKLTIKGFKKYGLTLPRYRVMRKLAQGRELSKAERRLLTWLQAKSWVSADGALTSYGETILAEAGPSWSGPPINKKTGKRKNEDSELVERAALGGCVRWRTLKDGKRVCAGWARKPIFGIHYQGTPIEEWLEGVRKRMEKESAGGCGISTDEESLDAAMADAVVPVERLRTPKRARDVLPGFA